jgi:hypothetical protein
VPRRLRAEYDLVSPDGPEHFPVVYAKTLRMPPPDPSSPRWRRSPPHARPLENPEVVNALLGWFLGH